MPEQTRTQRNLRDDITHAHNELKRWRQDGQADRIAFWVRRRDELLDRLAQVSAEQPKEPQPNA